MILNVYEIPQFYRWAKNIILLVGVKGTHICVVDS